MVEGLGFRALEILLSQKGQCGAFQELHCSQWGGEGAWWPHLSEPVLVPVPEPTVYPIFGEIAGGVSWDLPCFVLGHR